MKQNKTTVSYASMIGAMLIFGTIGLIRRWIPLSSSLLACLRGFIGAAVLFAFMLISGKKLERPGRKNLLLLMLSGAMIGINWMLLFEAYRYTTVATATLCYYMEPTIVILLSPLFFSERLTPKKAVCAALSVVGMVLVSGVLDGEVGSSDFVGVLFGLSAAVLYASVVILNKKIPFDNAYERTVIQLFSAALVLLPYVLITEDLTSVSLGLPEWLLVLTLGVVHTGFAYALYFAAMKALKGQSVAILGYIDPVSALILSAIVLGEGMTLFGILGALLIIGAALFSEISRKKKGL